MVDKREVVAIEEDQIRVQPNPFTNELRVELGPHTGVVVQVYQVDGRQVYSQQVSQEQIMIPTQKWQSGLYIMSINDDDGILKQVKLIK